MSATRKPRPTSIEECLFGPSRTCPNNVWEAVGDGYAKKHRRKKPSDEHLQPPESYAIPIQEVRRLASQGISDSYRGVVWRILLGGLPLQTEDWKEFLLTKRKLYRQLVADLFVEPQHDGNELRGHHGKKKQQAQARREYELNRTRSPLQTSGHCDEIEEALEALEPSEFSFRARGRRPSLTHTASDWLRRNSSQDDDNGDKRDAADEENEDTDESVSHNGSAKLIIERDAEVPEQGAIDTLTEKMLIEGSSSLDDNKSQDSDVQSRESLAEMVPAHIREEWKKSGRDTQTLDSMVDQGMNTLLVHNNKADKRRVSVSDDPLSTDTDSKWFQFFDSASLLDEIRKDVVRTHPDLYFFLEPEQNLGQRRYAALERILFVWAKLNKGVRYVQGMNEIVGTIYYVLANDDNEIWASEAEADTYFLFNTLMSEMRDIFVPDLDEADTGIQGRISNMTALLSLHDPEVRCHLVDIGIDPAFFAIRWLTTLLSREFLLPDTIRLWDSMFASTHKENFMRYVCVTMVMIIRNKLLKGDFSTCLRLLQAFPNTNIDTLLEASRALWIYESQVTLACHKGGISLHQALSTITPPPSIVMAYGLPGGVARARSEEVTPTRGRGFFSRANALINQVGEATREAASKNRNRTRTQTN